MARGRVGRSGDSTPPCSHREPTLVEPVPWGPKFANVGTLNNETTHAGQSQQSIVRANVAPTRCSASRVICGGWIGRLEQFEEFRFADSSYPPS